MRKSTEYNIIMLLETICAILCFQSQFTIAACIFAACAVLSASWMIVLRFKND